MIFGTLIALYSAIGLWMQSAMKDFGKLGALMPKRPGAPDPAVALEALGKVMEELKPYTNAIAGGMLIFSLALIAVGMGLYKRQAWSRPASLLWSGLALAFIPFQIFVQTQIVQPRVHDAMMKMYEGMPAGVFDGMMGMQTGLTIVMQVVFYAPFPVILLILMGRSSAKNDLLTS